MKEILFFLFTVLSASLVQGQQEIELKEAEWDAGIPTIGVLTNDVADTTVYVFVDREAEFPGGEGAMKEYIATVKYPTVAQEEKDPSGLTYVRFIVEKDGTVSNIEITRSSKSAAIDSAITEHLKKMPVWKPAIHEEKLVRTLRLVPVRF